MTRRERCARATILAATLTSIVGALGCRGAAEAPPDRPPGRVAPAPGEVPLPGRWRAIDGLPATCGARVAVDAAVSVAPLPWRACASGRVGCQAFFADWGTARDGFRFRPGVFEAAFEDAAGVHVSYLRSDGPAAPYTVHVVQRLHGRAEAVFWSPRGACAVAASASRHGLAVRALMPQGVEAKHYLAWSGWDAPTALTAVPTHYGEDAPLSQNAARGDGLITLEAMSVSGTIRGTAFRIGDRGFARSASVDALALERPLPIDGGFLALTGPERSGIVRVTETGEVRTLVEPGPTAAVTWLAIDRAHDAMVWSEASDGDSDAALFTAPLPGGAAGLRPRPVARIPRVGPLVANAGSVAFVVSPELARVVRISDGRVWDLPREPDAPWLYPLWVNDDAAWFVVSEVQPGEPGFPAQSGVVRIDRDRRDPRERPTAGVDERP